MGSSARLREMNVGACDRTPPFSPHMGCCESRAISLAERAPQRARWWSLERRLEQMPAAVSWFGRDGPFLRPGLRGKRRGGPARSRLAAGHRRRRRAAVLRATGRRARLGRAASRAGLCGAVGGALRRGPSRAATRSSRSTSRSSATTASSLSARQSLASSPAGRHRLSRGSVAEPVCTMQPHRPHHLTSGRRAGAGP